MGNHQNKKIFRKYFASHRFQKLLLTMNSTIFTLGIGFVTLQVFRSFKRLSDMGVKSQFPPNHPYFYFIDMQKSVIFDYILWSFIGCLILSVLATIVLSHKIMGPLYRLKIHLRLVAKTGKWPPLTFRKNDLFEELPNLLNEAFHSVEKSRKKTSDKK